MRSFVFTSESVSEGHPDKVCDQISDAILDAHFAGDTSSRVACETMVKNGVVALAGEITSNQEVDYTQVVRQAIKDIGYTDPSLGFDNDTCEILIFINQQSSDISMGVNEGEGTFTEQGAGDQGLMFGFACNETPELMPMPIALSHKLVHKLADVRKADSNSFLRPDSKSQVTIKYENGKPTHVDTIVVSTQHTEEATNEQIEELVREQVVKQVIPENLLSKDTRYFINPTGRFVIGGPVGDAGLTGRKIIVDTYGGYGRHGGGAFSGKDPSKVDRSAAYIARYLAKNVVAANLADRCEVQLAYAIGVAQPVSVFVETFGTAKADEEKIGEALTKFCDLTPSGIIKELNLLNPNKIYQQTAAYGHFGREFNTETGAFSWENTSRAKELAELI